MGQGHGKSGTWVCLPERPQVPSFTFGYSPVVIWGGKNSKEVPVDPNVGEVEVHEVSPTLLQV